MTQDTRGITKQILDDALAGDILALKALPKTDLHTHAQLAAPFEDTAQALGGRLPPPPSLFASLDDFLEHLNTHYWPHYINPERTLTICEKACEHMIRDGITLCEMSFDVLIPTASGTTWADFAPRLRERLARFSSEIDVRPELGVARELPRSVWFPEVRAALRTGIFRSVDLYGSEERTPVREFHEYFEMARAEQLKIKFHAGEGRNGERLLEEMQFVRPVAVQHGVAAAYHSDCMHMLRDTGIQLNVCPSSNAALRVVDSIAEHPVDILVRAGVRVSLATDDLAIFGSDVSQEYLKLYQAGKLTAAELEQIRLNGLEASAEKDSSKG